MYRVVNAIMKRKRNDIERPTTLILEEEDQDLPYSSSTPLPRSEEGEQYF